MITDLHRYLRTIRNISMNTIVADYKWSQIVRAPNKYLQWYKKYGEIAKSQIIADRYIHIVANADYK